MRVLLIDDHELLWNGTRRLLKHVVGELDPAASLHFEAVRDVAAALALPRVEPYDLILLDYHLPGESGIDALRTIQSAFGGAAVTMLSAESGSQRVRAVLEAGACGFIPKSYSEHDMAAALRLVLLRKAYVPAEFLFAVEVERASDTDDVHNEDLKKFLGNELSPRQRQVLKLALQGLPNKLIARRLEIAEGTVKVHLSMVYRALNVKNRVGALCRVLQADAAEALG